MSDKITAQDEWTILKILNLSKLGMTIPEVEQKAGLGEAKAEAVMDALAHKGHIYQKALKYFLQKPLADFKEPEEQ